MGMKGGVHGHEGEGSMGMKELQNFTLNSLIILPADSLLILSGSSHRLIYRFDLPVNLKLNFTQNRG